MAVAKQEKPLRFWIITFLV